MVVGNSEAMDNGIVRMQDQARETQTTWIEIIVIAVEVINVQTAIPIEVALQGSDQGQVVAAEEEGNMNCKVS